MQTSPETNRWAMVYDSRNLKNFSVYTPTEESKISLMESHGVVFIKSSEGKDWYDVLKEFSKDTLKICFTSDGTVVSFCRDASGMFPIGMSVAELEDAQVPHGMSVDRLWKYDGNFVSEKV